MLRLSVRARPAGADVIDADREHGRRGCRDRSPSVSGSLPVTDALDSRFAGAVPIREPLLEELPLQGPSVQQRPAEAPPGPPLPLPERPEQNHRDREPPALARGPAGRPQPREVRVARPLVGIGFKCLSAFVFTIMLTLIKLLGDRVPVGEMVFARNLFAAIPVVAMICLQGRLRTAFHTSRPWSHLGRATVGVTAMGLWFVSVVKLPIADATALSYAAPLMTVALASLVLKESVARTRWLAVGVGFFGVIVLLSPHLGAGEPEAATVGAVAAVGAACFMALAMIFIRKLTATEETTTIVIYFSLAAAGLSLVTLPFGWVVPTAEEALLLVSIGLVGGIGQLLLTQSYRFADASVIAPFEYTTIIWTLAIGLVLFGETPTLTMLVGAAIVVASGVAVVLGERGRAARRRRSAQAG
jgi:drug/metabolite transporter (DMT)-like permease